MLSVAWKTVSEALLLVSRLILFLQNGQQILSGGADNLGTMVDAVTGTITQFALHDAPIKVVKSVNLPYSNEDIAITGSWDKTVKVCVFIFMSQ